MKGYGPATSGGQSGRQAERRDAFANIMRLRTVQDSVESRRPVCQRLALVLRVLWMVLLFTRKLVYSPPPPCVCFEPKVRICLLCGGLLVSSGAIHRVLFFLQAGSQSCWR